MQRSIRNTLSVIVKVSALFAAIICGTGVLWPFSPSVDGRATVAPLGELPQGMFAKTVGYLPGDSITVTNLATHNTVDILVVGALDASQGIAISLSPEAAMMLGIKAGSDVMVKLTRRNGMMDEVVTGSAVLTPDASGKTETASTAPSANSGDTSNTTPPPSASVAAATPQSDSASAPRADVAASTSPDDQAVPNPPVSSAADTVLAPQTEGTASSVGAGDVALQTQQGGDVAMVGDSSTPPLIEPITPVIPVTETAPVNPAPEPPASQLLVTEGTLPAPVTERAPTAPETDKSPVQPVIEPATPPAEWAAALPPIDTPSVASGEPAAGCGDEQLHLEESDILVPQPQPQVETSPLEAVAESEAPAPQPEVKPAPEAVAESEAPAPQPEVKPASEAVAESDAHAPQPEVKAPPEVVAESDARAPQPEVKAAPTVAIAADDVLPPPEIEETYPAEIAVAPDTSVATSNEPLQSAESYAPIVLVPTGPKVPEEEAVREVFSPSAGVVLNAPKEPPAPSAPAKEEAVAVIAKPAILNPSDANAKAAEDILSRLTLPSISALNQGSYYVQFATFSSKARAKDALMKYGVDYPMAFVPSKKSATQAMIGPLTVDEYGAVLARFKSDGFGDAFLRKIK